MAELDDARAGKFTWGKVIEVHEIGPYAIVEYHPKRPDMWKNGLFVRKGTISSVTNFHVYVNGQDESISFGTLDEALIFAIAARHTDWNTAGHVTDVFYRGLNRRSR
jgi:hypothetical protein